MNKKSIASDICVLNLDEDDLPRPNKTTNKLTTLADRLQNHVFKWLPVRTQNMQRHNWNHHRYSSYLWYESSWSFFSHFLCLISSPTFFLYIHWITRGKVCILRTRWDSRYGCKKHTSSFKVNRAPSNKHFRPYYTQDTRIDTTKHIIKPRLQMFKKRQAYVATSRCGNWNNIDH